MTSHRAKAKAAVDVPARRSSPQSHAVQGNDNDRLDIVSIGAEGAGGMDTGGSGSIAAGGFSE
jgi:hypothetical protein